MKNILIVDDNKDITDVLATYVVKEGFQPIVAYDGEDALEKFEEYNPVVVLLDVMMPKLDGFKVCKKIRSLADVPVILITAKGEDYDRVMGLDIGADDYIVKPFSPKEVMARIRAVLRRMDKESLKDSERGKNVIWVKNLMVNMDSYQVTIDGKSIDLTKREVETLWILAKNPKKVFTRDNLLDSLWGIDYFGDSRTVDSHIKRLRKKLALVEQNEWEIQTVWGLGYRFELLNND